MAMLPKVFVPEEAEDAGFEVIPAGWVEAEIIKSSLETTKAKDGKYLSFCFKICDEGDYDGRMVFTNLNIENNNPTAVRIANSDLKAMCAAAGHEGDLEDTVDLHNIPMMIKLTVKAETSQWPAKNEIKGYKAV